MSRYISGIRPSGKLHLGNYIGSILPAQKYEADVLIAQYHAPHGNAIALFNELAVYFPRKFIKLQDSEFTLQLFFELLEVTPTGLLNHMPQYKEKDKNALMFIYPVLMAMDIAEYDFVIVGDDQRPHIEFAKDILHKVGYKCPEPIYEGGRVMDLRHPRQKMSKSTPESCLFLSDDIGTVAYKIKKAVTDEAGLSNLHFIYKSLAGEAAKQGITNSELKDAIVELLRGVIYDKQRITQ
jgi:tryptophanyl-tRNA synthetase